MIAFPFCLNLRSPLVLTCKSIAQGFFSPVRIHQPFSKIHFPLHEMDGRPKIVFVHMMKGYWHPYPFVVLHPYRESFCDIAELHKPRWIIFRKCGIVDASFCQIFQIGDGGTQNIDAGFEFVNIGANRLDMTILYGWRLIEMSNHVSVVLMIPIDVGIDIASIVSTG